MSTTACPLCETPIRLNERVCSSCGVDLAMAAVMTERALLDNRPDRGDFSVSPEVLVPRLGERLVDQGVLSSEDLQKALAYQQAQREAGHSILVGQALVTLGMVDPETLDRTITEQIFQLQEALTRANRDLGKRVREQTRDLRSALDRLSELNQLKSNFIANISHELRTPLSHIKGYTELLSDGSLGPVGPEQESAFEVMDRSILRLETLINDLIRFSESAQGDVNLRLTPVPVNMLLQRAAAHAGKRLGNHSFRLEIDCPADLPEVICDLEKITWVLVHLVDNAVKFTEGPAEIRLIAAEEEGGLRLAVRDEGIGIDADKLSEIFEPFHQLDASTTRKFGGTGLGLSLAKRILEAHRSEFSVRSTVGVGSTFSFVLPTTPDREPV
jgi:signal transduction histidine kinase